MTQGKQFDQIFGINKSTEDAEREFLNRVESTIFRNFPSRHDGKSDYPSYFKIICFELGLNPENYKYGGLTVLTKKNFVQTLRVIVILNEAYEKTNKDYQVYLETTLKQIMERAPLRLGIRWHDGMFYPDPIPEIDQYLIDDNLQFLNVFPAAKKDIQFALKNFKEGASTGILDKCYSALEQVAQELCGVKKPLHNNEFKKEILRRLSVSQKWKDFFDSFVQYANDTRHGTDPDRHEISPDEVESYLFLSLIMIRMVLKKLN